MKIKISLTIKKEVIDRAERYANQKGKSLQDIIEHYLIKIKEENKLEHNISPKLKKIVGAVSLPKDFDDEKEIHSILEQKHL